MRIIKEEDGSLFIGEPYRTVTNLWNDIKSSLGFPIFFNDTLLDYLETMAQEGPRFLERFRALLEKEPSHDAPR